MVAALVLAGNSACAAAFVLESPTIKPGGLLTEAQVYNDFGCHGKNLSPALAWKGAPTGTKSFALTVFDPDAPTGMGWWHWLVYNLPAGTSGLAEGAGAGDGKGLPPGSLQARTDFGSFGFGGACPPPGDRPHRYIFTVHALKADKLAVPADASAAQIGATIRVNQLAQAQLLARYGR
ncbi:MAG TPA: YbhB/YbcL family Raf kinase inhibitor-like protein [Ideonella sp.]|nr:YbhB/YbcL family Raf kinase inhibitor-like protein [Ideonella sp.]